MAIFGSWVLDAYWIDESELNIWDIIWAVFTLAIAAYWFTQQPQCAPEPKFMEEVGVIYACQVFIRNLVNWASVGAFSCFATAYLVSL